MGCSVFCMLIASDRAEGSSGWPDSHRLFNFLNLQGGEENGSLSLYLFLSESRGQFSGLNKRICFVTWVRKFPTCCCVGVCRKSTDYGQRAAEQRDWVDARDGCCSGRPLGATPHIIGLTDHMAYSGGGFCAIISYFFPLSVIVWFSRW